MLSLAALLRLLRKCPQDAWVSWAAPHRLMVWIDSDPVPLCWGWIDLESGMITQYGTPHATEEEEDPCL